MRPSGLSRDAIWGYGVPFRKTKEGAILTDAPHMSGSPIQASSLLIIKRIEESVNNPVVYQLNSKDAIMTNAPQMSGTPAPASSMISVKEIE